MTELLNFEEAELLFYLYVRESKRRPTTHRSILLLISDFTFCLRRYMRGHFSSLVQSLLVRKVISVSEKSLDYISWNEAKLHELTDSIDLNEVETIIPGPLEEKIVRALFFQKNYKKLESWLSASKYASVVLCRFAIEYFDVKAFQLLLWYHDVKDSIIQLYGYSLVKSLQFGRLQFINILLKENKLNLQDLMYYARKTNRYAEFEVDDHDLISAVIWKFGTCGVTFEILDKLKMVNQEDGRQYLDLERRYWKGYTQFLKLTHAGVGCEFGVKIIEVIVGYLRPKRKIR